MTINKSKKTYKKISFKLYLLILFIVPISVIFIFNQAKIAFAEEKQQDIIIPKADLQNIRW